MAPVSHLDRCHPRVGEDCRLMNTRSLASIAFVCLAVGAGCSSATPLATTSPEHSETPHPTATIVHAPPTPGPTRTPVTSPTDPPTAVPSESDDPRFVGP